MKWLHFSNFKFKSCLKSHFKRAQFVVAIPWTLPYKGPSMPSFLKASFPQGKLQTQKVRESQIEERELFSPRKPNFSIFVTTSGDNTWKWQELNYAQLVSRFDLRFPSLGIRHRQNADRRRKPIMMRHYVNNLLFVTLFASFII